MDSRGPAIVEIQYDGGKNNNRNSDEAAATTLVQHRRHYILLPPQPLSELTCSVHRERPASHGGIELDTHEHATIVCVIVEDFLYTKSGTNPTKYEISF